MKFIKLEILNLASLDREGGEVIDFEAGALKDSTIFSIVGPMGSGKSTLLDAICLALYNRAPRYPRQKGERNRRIEIYGSPDMGEKNRIAPTDCRNILTRGKKSGYSKLTFLANNGDIYRAEWHVRFQRVNYDNVVTSLYKLPPRGDGQEAIANWDDLPQIIGLDYEQFLRTVLIAQGSFADFLNTDVDDRYVLLEKLIGCEKLYSDIAARIKSRKEAAVEAFTVLNADFAAYEKDIIPDAELEPLMSKIRALEEEEQKVKEELARVTVAIQWFADENQYLKNIEIYQQAKLHAENDIKEAKADIDRLALHDATLQATACYKEMLQATAEISAQEAALKRIGEEIGKKQAEILQCEKEMVELKKAETDAVRTLEEQKPHINQARTIKGELDAAILVVREKEEARERCEEASRKAKKAVEDNANAVGQYRAALEQADKAWQELQAAVAKEQQQIASEVGQATEAFNIENKKTEGIDAARLQKAKSDAEQKQHDHKEAVRILKEMERKHDSLLKNAELRKTLTVRQTEIADELKKLQIDSLTAELETLRRTHTLMTSEDWALHRQHLEEGTPCPLCGATTHPYKREESLAPVVGDLQKLIDAKRETLATQTAYKTELDKEQGENDGKLQSLDTHDESLQKERAALQSDWAEVHQKNPEWTAEVAALELLLPEIEKAVEDASEALKTYNTRIAEVNRLRAAKEAAEEKQRMHIVLSTEKLTAAQNKKTEADTLLKTEQGKTQNLTLQAEEKSQAQAAAIKELEAAKGKVEEKKAALKNEIEDKDPDAYEHSLTKAKEDAAKAVEDKNNAISGHKEQLQGLTGQLTTTRESVLKLKQKLDENSQSLDHWLVAYNGTHEHQLTKVEIAALYSATDNWEEIRQRQAQLGTAFTRALTTFDNEVKSHEKHQEKKPSQPLEELEAKKNELEHKTNQELTDAKARMQRHEAAKGMKGELFDRRQAAESLKKDWEEIAQAIGADGKTLRKIAQCYTLRFLIEHANVEIRKFNSRYELQQVKNSLGIRVIDHDRADDIRDTTSLSGGETFIVSLGLALGLSALSSRNISFENLFIDEGFGTLDPDTLTTVIDSLAMLQSSQGKKVGVISHTDTMSERITTQIRVIKNGNSGSSHIEIYPPTTL